LPVLAQVFEPKDFKEVAGQLQKVTVPQQGFGLGTRSAYETIDPELNKYADKTYAGMGSSTITGYTVPSDLTFQGKPLEAKYDAKGNFQHMGLAGGDVLIPDPNQPNIASSPRFNKTGGIVDYGIFDLSKQDDGGFGSFIGELAQEFAPMIIAGLTANFLGPGGLPSTAGAGGASALDIAAHNALSNANMANYAGLISDAGISMAGVAPGAAASDLLAQMNLQYAGATPVNYGSVVGTPLGNLSETAITTGLDAAPSFTADYSLSQGVGDPGIKAINQATFADPTISPVDYSLNPVTTSGGPLPAGPGMKLPTMPSLNTMGGGQGLTTPAFADPGTIPGTVGAKGVTPFNAVPDLGDPKSFINNPDVTGLPRLDSDIFKPPTNYTDVIKNIGDVISKLDGLDGKKAGASGLGGSLGDFGSLQFGQSYLPGASYSAPESSMVRLKELPIVPALASVLQQRGMNTYAKGGRVHRPEFITGRTGHYAQGRGTGQSDDIPAVLHDGDYVVDADTVAAFGDGSSKAGAGALEQFRRSMPEHHSGGGQPIRAQIADGEYVLPAGFVTSLGRGSNKNGAKMLDAMREEIRAHKRSAPDTKIPPKAKKPMQYMREAMKG
jgi:hypothetical protein